MAGQTGESGDLGSIQKLFAAYMDTYLAMPPSPSDSKKIFEHIIKDCRTLAQTVARDTRHRTSNEKKWMEDKILISQNIEALKTKFNSMNLGGRKLSVWSTEVTEALQKQDELVKEVRGLVERHAGDEKSRAELWNELETCKKSHEQMWDKINGWENRLKKIEGDIEILQNLPFEGPELIDESIEEQMQKLHITKKETAKTATGSKHEEKRQAGKSDERGTSESSDLQNDGEDEEHGQVASLDYNPLIRPFTSTADMTFPEWLTKFEDFRDQQKEKWSDDVTLKKLKLYLNGDARERLLKYALDPTAEPGEEKFRKYADVRKDLLDSYTKDGGQAIARSELSVTRQRRDETISAFLERLAKLVARLDPDATTTAREKRVFEEFMSKVCDEIAEPLRLSIPENLEQARAKALALESIQAAKKLARQDALTETLVHAVQTMATISENMKAQQEKARENNERGSQQVECFYCHKMGHFARDCRTKMFDRQKYQQNRGGFRGSASRQSYSSGIRGQGSSNNRWKNNERFRNQRPRNDHVVTSLNTSVEDHPRQAEKEKAMKIWKEKRERLLRSQNIPTVLALRNNEPVSQRWPERTHAWWILMLMMMLFTPITMAQYPMICQNKFGRRLVKLPGPPDCPKLSLLNDSKPKRMEIEIFQHNAPLINTPAQVCQISKSQIRYFTTLTGVKVEQAAHPTAMEVSKEECQQMIATRTCRHGGMVAKHDGWITENKFERNYPWPVLGSFSWTTEEIYNCMTFNATVQIDTRSQEVTSNAGRVVNGTYRDGYSHLEDGSAIVWTPEITKLCPFKFLGNFDGRIMGNVWLSNNSEFALTLLDNNKMTSSCGKELELTPQGYAVGRRKIRHQRDAKQISPGMLATSMQALREGIVRLLHHQFSQVLEQTCRNQAWTSQQWKSLAVANPTATIRQLMKNQLLHARMLTPDVLEVFPCRPVFFHSIWPQPLREKRCTQYLPIAVADPTIHYTNREAFLDPSTLIITDESPSIPCNIMGSYILPRGKDFLEIDPRSGKTKEINQSAVLTMTELRTGPKMMSGVPLIVFSATDLANFSDSFEFQHWQALHKPTIETESSRQRPNEEGFFPELKKHSILSLMLPKWPISDIWLYSCAAIVTLHTLVTFLRMYFEAQLGLIWAFVEGNFPKRRRARTAEEISVTNWPPAVVSTLDTKHIYTQLPVTLNGLEMSALLDTGASMTVMSVSFAPLLGVELEESYVQPATSASGHALIMEGKAEVTAKIGNITRQILVSFTSNEHFRDKTSYDVILGCDALAKFPSFSIDMASRTVQFGNCKIALMTPEQMTTRPRKLQILSNILIPPQSAITVQCAALLRDMPENFDLFIDELTQKLQDSGLEIPPTLISKSEPTVLISNPTRAQVQLFAGQTLSNSAQPTAMRSSLCGPTVSSLGTQLRTQKEGKTNQNDPDYFVDLTTSATDENGKRKLQKLLEEFPDVFAKNQYDLGRAKVEPQDIHTTTEVPVFSKPHRVPYQMKNEFDQHIQKLLQSGAMKPSQTPWVSPVVMVRKKDGTLRPCIDFRKLNAVTIPDRFPMPTIEDVLTSVGGCTWYSSLDLASGFWQIPLTENASRKCGVITAKGVYEMTRMPFGLVNATSIFSRVMTSVLTGLDQAISYVDDVLVFTKSEDLEDHIADLKTVFDRFRSYGLKLSPKKCRLATKSLSFLGHTLDKDGYRPEKSHVQAVEKYPRPTTVKQVRRFLGMAGFYHKFIPNFAQIAEPMYRLLRDKTKFHWESDQQKAFEAIKEALVSDSVLTFPTYDKPFHLFVDGSQVAMGASLMQLIDGSFRPIAHVSRTLALNERKWPAVQIELAAIIWSLRTLRPFIYNCKIIVHSDHKPLSFLDQKRTVHPHLQRWAVELQQYDLELVHVRGQDNVVADALSRIPEEQSEENYPPASELDDNVEYPFCLSIDWTKSFELKSAQNEDLMLAKIRKGLNGEDPDFLPEQGEEAWIFEKAKINADNLLVVMTKENDSEIERPLIPEAIRQSLFSMVHSSPNIGAHLGAKKTIQKMSRYAWYQMAKDIKQWCEECQKCQQFSMPRISSRTEVIPWISQYDGPMQLIGLDLCGPLPKTDKGNLYILNMIDMFTKYIVSVPIPNATAETVSQMILDKLIFIHGTPRAFLSDNGPCFKAHLFQMLTERLGIEHKTTVPHHSTGNGAVERSFRTYHALLAKAMGPSGQFDEILPAITFAYNTSSHSTTMETPFYLTHGRDPQFVSDILLSAPSMHLIVRDNDVLDFRARLTTNVRLAWNGALEESRRSAEQFEKFYNKKSKPGRIHPGTLVLKRVFIEGENRSRKQWMKFDGPYRVESVVPPHAIIRPVDNATQKGKEVHLDQIKPYYGQILPPHTPPPEKQIPQSDPERQKSPKTRKMRNESEQKSTVQRRYNLRPRNQRN
ncbi:unnamed protein product [Bursaphelenchus xylophilus]|uniref:RNA-directed DNA polymerase n=1 Tax=Bursaphelenchus xylophilus TaxID=6326 RepID=A0A1I7S4P1_BURXY|nr:unnamed protein product [Bursaphelenchus xylophilus]CAG9117267.1 unnamed protein product [Bursaphelenchus xylophilus]